jgi:hypothetical protein
VITVTWVCDRCSITSNSATDNVGGESTPPGLYIPSVFLRAKRGEPLEETKGIWFCATCMRNCDDEIGPIIINKVVGLRAVGGEG